MEQLEEQIAHLIRTVDDLSDIVARQEGEIATLTRRVTERFGPVAARPFGESLSGKMKQRPRVQAPIHGFSGLKNPPRRVGWRQAA